MNVVSAVANLQKECDYYREASREQAAIIKQLTEGPGEVEYIHPLDFEEMLSMVVVNSQMKKVRTYSRGPYQDSEIEASDIYEFPLTGKKYKQSQHIPARTKRLK